MLAGVAAAYIGPNGNRTQSAIAAHLYAVVFGLSALMICAMGVLTMYVPSTPKSLKGGSGRSLLTIAKQPNFQLALAAAVAAWSIMSLLMTATPVAMHEVDGFNMKIRLSLFKATLRRCFYLPGDGNLNRSIWRTADDRGGRSHSWCLPGYRVHRSN